MFSFGKYFRSFYTRKPHVGDICQVVDCNVKDDTLSHLFRVLFNYSISLTWRFSTWTSSKRDGTGWILFYMTRFSLLFTPVKLSSSISIDRRNVETRDKVASLLRNDVSDCKFMFAERLAKINI